MAREIYELRKALDDFNNYLTDLWNKEAVIQKGDALHVKITLKNGLLEYKTLVKFIDAVGKFLNSPVKEKRLSIEEMYQVLDNLKKKFPGTVERFLLTMLTEKIRVKIT